jgi:hypothetical protein
MKKVVIFILISVFVQGLFAQTQPPRSFDFSKYGVKIEPEKRLIIVMAALDAGGLETKLTSKGDVFRKQLREDLAENLKAKSDTVDKIKTFIAQYKRRHPKNGLDDDAYTAEIASPFVSLAYALGPVPELNDPKKVDDLPGDLLEIFDFAPLVREFYRNSGIELKMPQYLRSYQAIGDLLSPSARQMTLELCDYLHTRPQLTYAERIVTKTGGGKGQKALSKTETRIKDRRFFIVPDLLTPIKTVNFRNIGDDYFAIVPPDTNLLSSEVRRGYLQFIADSLVAENVKDISPHKDAIKALLENSRKQAFQKETAKNPKLPIEDNYVTPDIFLAVSKSFVAAADIKESEFRKIQYATYLARQKIDVVKTIEEKKAVSAELETYTKQAADETALRLSESYERGAVLVFYFAQQFKGLEESGFDVAGSFKDMLQTLDPTKEQNRLGQFADSRNRGIENRESRQKAFRQSLENNSAASKAEILYFSRLDEIDDMISIGSLPQAESRIVQLLDEYPNDSRLFYLRGKVASASADGGFEQEIVEEKLAKASTYFANSITEELQKKAKNLPFNARLVSKAYHSLARIFEFNDEIAKALASYRKAIEFGNATIPEYLDAKQSEIRLTKKN